MTSRVWEGRSVWLKVSDDKERSGWVEAQERNAESMRLRIRGADGFESTVSGTKAQFATLAAHMMNLSRRK